MRKGKKKKTCSCNPDYFIVCGEHFFSRFLPGARALKKELDERRAKGDPPSDEEIIARALSTYPTASEQN